MEIRVKPLLLALLSAASLGGILTGTLVWLDNRARPVVKAVSPLASKTDGAKTQTASAEAPAEGHGPPAELVRGLSPAQAARTLGNWNYDHKRWKEAIQNYRRALQSGEGDANLRTDLGTALRFGGQPQEALRQFQLAQKQDPAHELSLFNQGALYAVSLRDPRRGVAVWKLYLKRFPGGEHTQQARQNIAKFTRARG